MNTTYTKYVRPAMAHFDEIFNVLNKVDNTVRMPPYDVVDLGEGKYALELAVAGYGPEDIKVSINRSANVLTVKGEKVEDTRTKLHNGIARRSFTKNFDLAPFMEVVATSMHNGILSIKLTENKPKDNIMEIPISVD